MAKKEVHRYEVAWSEKGYATSRENYFHCEATDAMAAVRLTRTYLRDSLGYPQNNYTIHEIYCI